MRFADTNIPAATRAALAAAGAERREARAKHEAAVAALNSARQVLQDAQTEVDRLGAEETAWHERLSRKVAAWIENGSRGQRPVASADAKATLAIASARANLAAAQGAVPKFESAEATAREVLEAAEGRVGALKLADHRQFVEGLIARRAELEAEIHAIRQLASATLAAADLAVTQDVGWSPRARNIVREIPGGTRAFAGVVTAAQIERLNTPPAWLDLSALHAGRRAVVDVNTSIAAAREPLAESLDFWMCRDAELEAIAERGEIPQTEEAAA
jgi:hypothetical protein